MLPYRTTIRKISNVVAVKWDVNFPNLWNLNDHNVIVIPYHASKCEWDMNDVFAAKFFNVYWPPSLNVITRCMEIVAVLSIKLDSQSSVLYLFFQPTNWQFGFNSSHSKKKQLKRHVNRALHGSKTEDGVSNFIRNLKQYLLSVVFAKRAKNPFFKASPMQITTVCSLYHYHQINFSFHKMIQTRNLLRIPFFAEFRSAMFAHCVRNYPTPNLHPTGDLNTFKLEVSHWKILL